MPLKAFNFPPLPYPAKSRSQRTVAPCNSPTLAPLAYFHRLPLDSPFPLESLVSPTGNSDIENICSLSQWRTEDVLKLRVSESNLFLRDLDFKLNSVLSSQSYLSSRSASSSWSTESHTSFSASNKPQFPYLFDPSISLPISEFSIIRQESPQEILDDCSPSQEFQTCFNVLPEPTLETTNPLKVNQCRDCHRQFRRKQDLKRHERIHSNLRPFVCVHCNQTFSRRDAQKRHSSRGKCSGKPVSVPPMTLFNATVEPEDYSSLSPVSSHTPSFDSTDILSDNNSIMCHPLTPLEQL